MLKLTKYLKRWAGAIVCIVALLFLQAFCDLSLPDYTANIVNVGIQQQGISDGVPEKLRRETGDALQLFLTEEEQEIFSQSYSLEGEAYRLQEVSKEEREELNRALGTALLCLEGLTADTPQTAQLRAGLGLPEGEALLPALAGLPKKAAREIREQAKAGVEGMPESMITQSAVAFVRGEYEAMGEDVDALQMKYLLRSGLQMLGLALLGVVSAVGVTFLASRVAAGMGCELRSQVYRKVVDFSSGEFQKFSTASLITRSTNDIQQVQIVTVLMFRIVLYAPIMGIGGLAMVLRTEPSMTWILGLAVILLLLVIGVLFGIAMPKFTKLQTLIDRLNLVTREFLTGIPVIRAFSREKYEEERFEEANHRLMRTNLFVNRCMTFMMPAMMLIMNGVSVLIIYSGAHSVDEGAMQVGNVMAFIQYAMQVIMSFLMLTMMSIMLPRANVSAKRINEVLETENSLPDPKNPEEPDPKVRGLVEFDHVSFAYPDADELALEDIHFTARKGETVAFIGSTGSGKSTLVNLIPRLYDVTKGAVRVDGVDVRRMDKGVLAGKLGYVPQKGVLFSGTIESNIAYGRPKASKEEIADAARIAQAEEFITAKEEQYESPIAQGGTNVSGGQKQRLSIARAIAKKPEIFLFDDSFSALDYKTDAALRRALKEATQEATVLIVAQRISTILHADRILVLDEGKVVGSGTHKELLETCETYREIAMSQLSEEELA